MKVRDDFCVFILSNGRPDRVHTYRWLKRAGYTRNVFIVVDDEDGTADKYRTKFGRDKIIQFCKAEMDELVDTGDNFYGRASTIFPRKALWGIAEKLGFKYFLQLDDDYVGFEYYLDPYGNYRYAAARRTIEAMFAAMLDYFTSIPAKTLAMAQGGDLIGGAKGAKGQMCMRKAMNVFFCSTDRPWDMYGRRNEDVTAYVLGSLRGDLFLTTKQVKITQVGTQKNPGLITDSYLESGTYVKSFYSVMYAPACVRIGVMGDNRANNFRIHHEINWTVTAPKILREGWKK